MFLRLAKTFLAALALLAALAVPALADADDSHSAIVSAIPDFAHHTLTINGRNLMRGRRQPRVTLNGITLTVSGATETRILTSLPDFNPGSYRLERFLYRCSDSIAAVTDVVGALRGGEERQRGRDERVDVIKGAGPRGAQERFEFREGLLDRIKVGCAC